MQGERGSQDHRGRLPFPALDPEFSRAELIRRRLRNWSAAAAVIVILAGLGGLATYLLRGHVTPHRGASERTNQQTVKTLPASAAPVGTVLSQTPRGALAISGLRGQPAPPLMSLPQQVFVSPSLDNAFLAVSNGLLVSVGAHGHLSATHLKNVSTTKWSPVGPEPLADHDRFLALEYSGASAGPGDNAISVRSLATGKSESLGSGDLVAGDPAAAGVVASLPVASLTSGAPANGLWPDGMVVLRDAGQKAVVLGTAAQLYQDVHLPAGTLANFFPSPDPAGDKIAIVVQPLNPAASAGVVVVTRSGRVVYAVGGAGRSVSVSWSLSGQSLAIAGQGPHESVLRIWTASGSPSVQPFPGHAGYTDCVWSPDGAWILCALAGEHSDGKQWVVAAASGGPMAVTKGPGFPLSWIGDGR